MKESYLMWLEDKVALIVGDGDGDGEDDNNLEVENEKSTTTTTEVNKLFSLTTNMTTLYYTLAKKAPFPNIPVDQLMTDYGAVDFILALASFHRENVPQCKIIPSQFDRFDIFKQIIITLPSNLYLSNQT